VATDVAADPAKDGLWEQYIQLFVHALQNVHSVLSPPLNTLGITQTWAPSVAAFTLGVRSLLIPLSVQQSLSTERTKALKPYQNKIKERFPDDKLKQNEVLSKLFEDAKMNPLAGCFTSLASLPVFLGLYRSVNALAKTGEID